MNGTDEAASEMTPEQAYAYESGLAVGCLMSRYFALRYEADDEFFNNPVPQFVPDIVSAVLSRISRFHIDESLFFVSWRDLDDLLRCNSVAELEMRLAKMPNQLCH